MSLSLLTTTSQHKEKQPLAPNYSPTTNYIPLQWVTYNIKIYWVPYPNIIRTITCQHQFANVICTAWMHLHDMYDVYIHPHGSFHDKTNLLVAALINGKLPVTTGTKRLASYGAADSRLYPNGQIKGLNVYF